MKLLLILCLLLLVNLYLGRCKGHLLDKMQVGITASNNTMLMSIIAFSFARHPEKLGNNSPYKLACQVQEWLLIIVVTLGRNLVVLKVLLSVKRDLFGLHLPVLDINLVATQDNRDILTDSAVDRRQLLVSLT